MWSAKQQIICSLNESLWDVYNYGLFQPAGEGRDAKFLEEEQALRDYSQSFEKGVPYLEVRGVDVLREIQWTSLMCMSHTSVPS